MINHDQSYLEVDSMPSTQLNVRHLEQLTGAAPEVFIPEEGSGGDFEKQSS